MSQGVGAGTRVWGPEWPCGQAQWLSCLKGPEEVCKSSDFRTSGGGPEGALLGAISEEKDREAKGLNFLAWGLQQTWNIISSQSFTLLGLHLFVLK